MLAYIKANVKLIIVIALAMAMGFALIQWTSQSLEKKNQDIGKLETQLKNKDETIKEREDELARLKSSTTETEKAKVELKEEIKETKKKTTAAVQEVIQQKAAIEEKYDALPKTANNADRKNSELAIAKGMGQWSVICIQEPKRAECAK